MLIVRGSAARLFAEPYRAPGRFHDCAADAAGYEELRRHLVRNPRRPIHLLVDVVEENLHRETVPHVVGGARRKMLATRAARLFRGTPYIAVRREGREPAGRRDDRVLFSAIVRPETLQPWLDLLHECGAPVAGVHSLPIVSARLWPYLDADPTGRVLLATESGPRDLRQTVLEGERVVLSRLAPLPAGDPAQRAGRIVAEIEKTRNHLDRLHRAGEPLRIRLVGSPGLRAALRELEGPGGLSEGFVDRASFAHRLGVPQRRSVGESAGGGNGNGDCDSLFAWLVSSRPPVNHYAPTTVLALHRSKRAARALVAAGAAAFVAGSVWSGAAWHRSLDLAAAAEARGREAGAYDARYLAERRPESAVALHDLRLAVEKARELDTGRLRVLPIFRAVSGALSGFPTLQLESFEWFEISEHGDWPHAQPAGVPRERLRIVLLRGRIEPFNGHYRRAAEEVFRFSEALEAVPRLSEVEVWDVPRDPAGEGLRGVARASFEIRMLFDVRGA